MSSRIKFLFLIFVNISGGTILAVLFMRTDYARNEMAYFREYPYRAMTAQQITVTKRKPLKEKVYEGKIPSSVPVAENIPQKLMIAASPTQTDLPIVTAMIRPPYDAPPPKAKNKPVKFVKTVRQPPNPPQVITAITDEKQPATEKNTEKNWRHDAKLGYEAYGRGNYIMAILHFDHALEHSADPQDIRLQLAYAHKILGQNTEAIRNFKKTIDHYDPATAPFALRREVEQLENRFEVNGYAIYRDESSTTQQLGADLTQSQAGVEVSYQPKNIGLYNGRKFQIYARFLSGMEQDRLRLNTDSYQAGFGLRLKPLSNHNLVLSAERLVKVGDFARNDWMLRAGYSLDHGTDYREDMTQWWSYSLYLDAALIDPADPDIFLTAQVTSGYNISISEGLVLQPRLTALTSWQKNSFRTSSLIEAGPGVNIRYYFNDTHYEAYRSYIDLNLEYRIKLSGNSIGGSGPIVGLLLHF